MSRGLPGGALAGPRGQPAAAAPGGARPQPRRRGAITGLGTFLGGVVHTLPFLIPQYRAAVLLALAAMAVELLTLAWIRRRSFGTGFLRSFIFITLGGVIIATISAALGAAVS
jgi:hypothetical protein